uniref:Cilia-and flagella-associated protein 96 n=1 Tax=Geotrypetes seraphini TaxID=260995 RepID=A0A6P8QM27_GEOSA|nr:UPF0602 protein C4orf47 homolog isoform X2 [Geotrypetes seraphini]
MGAEGKTDMERLGLFSEMEYVTIGDSYIPSLNRPFNDAAGKGRQMFPGGSKLMSDLQAGYFDAQFKRVFTGEGYSNPIKLRRLYRLDQSKRNLGKSFLPSSVSKKRYPNLTIGKPFAYSAEIYDKGPRKKGEEYDESKLIKGGPFRLNLYPREYFDPNPYHVDKPLPPLKKTEEKKIEKPFRPSSPSKKMGGMKAGTFDPYPTHSTDPYKTKYEKEVAVNKSGKIFHPLAGTKTRPVRSVLQAYVLKSVNTKNYKTLNLESY